MNFFRPLIAIVLLCTTGWIQAAEFTVKVIAVMDGDTLMVMQGDRPVKVRLAEIDAPEKAQPYGMASQQSLAELVMGKQIHVTSRAIDDYGRMIAIVSVAGLNVNHEQVRRGMAWEYSRFHNNTPVMALQREAQQARRGLWAGEGSIEPAQWRKLHPGTLSATASADPSCAKKQCVQMSSCEEARDYLSRCGNKSLDGDGDGMPCEELCMPQKKIRN
jgi:endonuclease YncB( thermonuclease family)